MPHCNYCQSNNFPNIAALHRHQGHAKQCLQLRHLYRQQLIEEQRAQRTIHEPVKYNLRLNLHPSSEPNLRFTQSPELKHVEHDSVELMEVEEQENTNTDTIIPDQDAQRPRVEEVPDQDDIGIEYVEPFPEEAGTSCGQAQTLFESIHDEQVLRGAEILGPFESEAEWQLAKWLIKNVGHNQAEAFLKLPIVSDE